MVHYMYILCDLISTGDKWRSEIEWGNDYYVVMGDDEIMIDSESHESEKWR